MMNINIYFRPTRGYFWHWEEDATVIAIPAGSTIAYYQPVMEILKALSFQGLPLFGPFLLVLAALSPSGEILLNEIKVRVRGILPDKPPAFDLEIMDQVFAFLEMLSGVPEKYKQEPYKVQLLQVVFENVHNQVGRSTAKAMLHSGRHKAVFEDLENVLSTFRIDFKIMQLLSFQFPDIRGVLEKMAALPEIEEVPAPLEQQLPSEKIKPDFVQELIENPKTFHVGALIKRIWSGLNIPFHSQLPSHQPLGGVSDLTNKGDFDKLLISEFANDDLVFMSRLANNEALYIRREIPPAHNNLNRIVLIDISIKNWGTPRTIAYAIMVAIAKHPKTDFTCTAFAVGNDIYPVRFDTVDDILDGLQVLEGSIDPVKGLAQFINLYGHSKNIEVVFITTIETMQLPAMQKIMYEHAALFNYWIYTGINGQVSLYKRQQNSKKHVQDFVLPLAHLWEKPKSGERGKSPVETAPFVPLYPLLFRCALKPTQVAVTVDGDIFAITSERHLMRAVDKKVSYNKGWELLYENLPPHSNKFAVGKMTDGTLIILLFNLHNRDITLLNLNNGVKTVLNFREWQASRFNEFIFSGGLFYYFTDTKYTVIDPVAGTIERSKDDMDNEQLALYRQQEELLTQSRKMALYYPGILKNITKVFINSSNNLVFNNIELHLQTGKQIYLATKNVQMQPVIEAVSTTSKTTFVFPDGSAVLLNRSGMLCFKSANDDISVFYIPSVIDFPLAIGTESEFAGNEFFRPERPDIRINSDAINKFWQMHVGRYIGQIMNHHYNTTILNNGTSD